MRTLQKLLTIAVITLLASCGAGSGTERELPAGPQTSAAASDNVLYVAFAQSNLIAAFRLGTDGFLPAAPFSTMAVPSPRTMLVDGGFIYVGTRNRVVSATINPDGSLPPLPTAETARVEDGDVSDMLVIGDVLYAAYTEVERLVTYRLEFGQVATGISSSSGESFSNYLTMDEDNGFIYVHAPGLGRIDTFMIRPDGFLEEFAEPQLPEVDLFGCEKLIIRDGIIYAAASIRERINMYTIDSVGFPEGLDDGEDPISNSEREERYVDLLLDGDLIYAAAFNKGRIDTYMTNPDGTLEDEGPFSKTEFDTALYPTSLLLLNGILYVAQAGRDRIDGYFIGGDGSPSGFPATSTIPIRPGFPNTIAHGVFPP
jgi:hypothetical protein